MGSGKLQQQAEAFKEKAEGAEKLLSGLIDRIGGGQVPAPEEISDCTAVLTAVLEQYRETAKTAAGYLLKEERPAEGAPLDAYLAAVAKSRARRLEEAERVLAAFLETDSGSEVYRQALEPYLKAAREKSGIVSSQRKEKPARGKQPDAVALEEVPGVADEELFVDALSGTDTDSEEYVALLERINQVYGFRIACGIAMHKYFLKGGEKALPKAEEKAAGTKGRRKTAAKKTGSTAAGEEGAAAQETAGKKKTVTRRKKKQPEPVPGAGEMPAEGKEAAGTSPVEAASPADSAPAVSQSPKESAAQSAPEEGAERETPSVEAASFAAVIREQQALLPEDFVFPAVSVQESPAEKKKVTAGIFTRDISQVPEDFERAIGVVAHCAAKTFLVDMGIVMKFGVGLSEAEGAAAFLVKKGYLREYTLTPGGSFYCATERLNRAVMLKSVAKLLKVRQLQSGELYPPMADTASAALSSLCYLTLRDAEAGDLVGRGISDFSESGYRQNGSFVLSMVPAGGAETAELPSVYLGDFWTDTEAAEVFERDLDACIGKAEGPYRKIVFASGTKQTAGRFAEVILGIRGEALRAASADLWLYVFPEDRFYAWDGPKDGRAGAFAKGTCPEAGKAEVWPGVGDIVKKV